MCGRYGLVDPTLVEQRFGVSLAEISGVTMSSRYNVSPGQQVLTVLERNGARAAESFRWGLPSPAKGSKGDVINARNDRLAKSPFWRQFTADGRCLIPASGFFEWRAPDTAGERKTPFWFSIADQLPFAFAGLTGSWRDRDGESRSGCVIVTTEANDLVASVHARMPVILAAADESKWLNGSVEEALALTNPYRSVAMTAIAVGPAVGNPRNDDSSLIQPAGTED